MLSEFIGGPKDGMRVHVHDNPRLPLVMLFRTMVGSSVDYASASEAGENRSGFRTNKYELIDVHNGVAFYRHVDMWEGP